MATPRSEKELADIDEKIQSIVDEGKQSTSTYLDYLIKQRGDVLPPDKRSREKELDREEVKTEEEKEPEQDFEK